MMGGVVSAPTLAGVLGGCQGRGGRAWRPRALSEDQHERVAAIAEVIIPETDTPGARQAGVDRFIDTMLADWYPATDRDRFLAGLDEVEARAQAAFGSSFVQGTPEQQAQLVGELDRAAFADASLQKPPFFRMMKELTLFGYYTSEVGATQELAYHPVPGRYEGDVPYPSEVIDRAMVGAS